MQKYIEIVDNRGNTTSVELTDGRLICIKQWDKDFDEVDRVWLTPKETNALYTWLREYFGDL